METQGYDRGQPVAFGPNVNNYQQVMGSPDAAGAPAKGFTPGSQQGSPPPTFMETRGYDRGQPVAFGPNVNNYQQAPQQAPLPTGPSADFYQNLLSSMQFSQPTYRAYQPGDFAPQQLRQTYRFDPATDPSRMVNAELARQAAEKAAQANQTPASTPDYTYIDYGGGGDSGAGEGGPGGNANGGRIVNRRPFALGGQPTANDYEDQYGSYGALPVNFDGGNFGAPDPGAPTGAPGTGNFGTDLAGFAEATGPAMAGAAVGAALGGVPGAVAGMVGATMAQGLAEATGLSAPATSPPGGLASVAGNIAQTQMGMTPTSNPAEAVAAAVTGPQSPADQEDADQGAAAAAAAAAAQAAAEADNTNSMSEASTADAAGPGDDAGGPGGDGDFARGGNVKGAAWRRRMDPRSLPGIHVKTDHRFADGGTVPPDDEEGFDAYHGSPYEFERFDSSKIGTGEGAQAFGYGHYLAENEGVARSYRDKLTNLGDYIKLGNYEYDPATLRNYINDPKELDKDIKLVKSQLEKTKKLFQNSPNGETHINSAQQYVDHYENLKRIPMDQWPEIPQGHMYQVRVKAKPEHFLDWDAPLSEQSDHVKNVFGVNDMLQHDLKIDEKIKEFVSKVKSEKDKPSDQDKLTVKLLEKQKHKPHLIPGANFAPKNNEEAEKLQTAGIPGIKYFDRDSRSVGEGTRNYVIFDPDMIHVKRRYADGGAVDDPTMQQMPDMPRHFSRGGTEKISVIHATPNTFDEFKTPKERGSKSSSSEANWLWFGEHDNADELTDMFGHRVAEASINIKPHKINYKNYDQDSIYDPQIMEKILNDHKDKKAIEINGIALKEFGEPKTIYAVQDSSVLSRPQWRKDWDIPVESGANVSDLPRYADGGQVPQMNVGDDPTVQQALNVTREYQDPPTKHIDDWAWKSLADVQNRLGNFREIPSHVQAFGNYMDEIAKRAANEGLSARDLIKAYTITRASIQRRANDVDRVRAAGLDLPSSFTGKIRPEGAFGEWLHTRAGQDYLNSAERGEVNEDAITNAVKIMTPFGKHEKDIPDALRWAANNLPGKEQAISSLVANAMRGASEPAEWRSMAKDVRGIGPSKAGFLASLMGRGDQPTLDARQIIEHTGRPTSEAQAFLRRKGGEGATEAVERLSARQRAMDLQLPEELKPYYQHLAHHAVWDKAADEVTTHEDVMNAMRGAAHGGEIDESSILSHPVVHALRLAGLPKLGAVPREGLRGGGSPDDDVVRQALQRVASPFSQDPEVVQQALRIASSLKVPQGEESGTGSFYSIKQPMAVSDVSTQIDPLPGVNLAAKNLLSWEDFYKQGKGGTILNVGGDRSNLGRLTHINNKELAWPVDLHAGPKYMMEPNPGAVWANNPSHATALRKKILEAAEKGPVYGVYAPMGARAVDSSHNMFDAVMAQIPSAGISKKDAKEFDDAITNGLHVKGNDPKTVALRENAKKELEGWPGILNAKEASEYARNMPGGHRSAIVKFMDSKKWRDMNFPAVGITRVAITDPELKAAAGNMLGHRVVEFDPEKIAKETKFQHSTYTSPTSGRYVGDVPLVQRQYAMPDVVERILQNPTVSGQIVHPYSMDKGGRDTARKFFEEQKQLQPVNERMINTIGEGLERQKDYGLKRGGNVVEQALRMTAPDRPMVALADLFQRQLRGRPPS